jgi:hypothetical protein
MSPTKITLSRSQVEQLHKIVSHFTEIEDFTLVIDNSNGIGPVVKVHFTMFKSNDANIDITDVTNW